MEGFGEPMRIERPHNAAIAFRESRKASAVFVAIASAVILAWEWMIWGAPTSMEDVRNLGAASSGLSDPAFYMLAALPGFLVPPALRRLAVAIFGRVIAFDGLSRTVTKNNRILAGFDDIEHFRLRKWDDSNVRGHLFLTSDKKIRLGRLCRAKEFHRVRSDIAGLLKTAEPAADPTESPSKNDLFIPLSIVYYGTRTFGILLFAASVLLPVASMTRLTDRLHVEGNMWAGSVFLFLFGLLLYGVSWFFKSLRHIKL